MTYMIKAPIQAMSNGTRRKRSVFIMNIPFCRSICLSIGFHVQWARAKRGCCSLPVLKACYD